MALEEGNVWTHVYSEGRKWPQHTNGGGGGGGRIHTHTHYSPLASIRFASFIINAGIS